MDKKRYIFGHSCCDMRIFDTVLKKEYKIPQVPDILNKQEERIKELEKQLRGNDGRLGSKI